MNKKHIDYAKQAIITAVRSLSTVKASTCVYIVNANIGEFDSQ